MKKKVTYLEFLKRTFLDCSRGTPFLRQVMTGVGFPVPLQRSWSFLPSRIFTSPRGERRPRGALAENTKGEV